MSGFTGRFEYFGGGTKVTPEFRRKYLKERGKAAPRKRPRRIAKKLAKRGGYMRVRPASAFEAVKRGIAIELAAEQSRKTKRQ